MNDLAIYIHWPWCKKKCPYCDFNSHVMSDDITDAYVNAVIADMQYQKELIAPSRAISIFFGGGTPSLMPPKHLEKLLNAVQKHFPLDSEIEITMEANPTSVNKEKFRIFKDIGINRLSLGVQSLRQEHLSFLGREHSAKEALNCIEYINSIFNNTNIDFIYGMPNQTLQSWEEDLSTICKLGTTHVSAYQLTIEKHTKFFSDVKKGKWFPLEDDQQADFIELTENFLKSYNFNRYEISNFSKDSYKCKHNNHIWRYRDYIGLGAGAHGRVQTIENNRIFSRNYKLPYKYISSVEHVKHGFYELENIPQRQAIEEKLLSGLRLTEGVQANEQLMENINKQYLKNFLSLNLMFSCNGKIGFTSKGMMIMDYLLSELII